MIARRRNIEVHPSFGLWVKRRRRELGLTQKDLISRLAPYPSERTVKSIESGKQFTFRDSTLMKLAEGLKINFTILLQIIDEKFVEKIKPDNDKWFYDNIYNVCNNIDEYLIEMMRGQHPTINKKYFYNSYKDLLSAQLQQLDIDLEEFLSLHRNSERIKIISESIPIPKLVINVDDDFQKLIFKYSNFELVVDKPQLLWPCSCKTSPPEICVIHSSKLGDQIDSLMEKELVEIRWKGYSFLWKQCKGLWPPSIDSFHFLDTLLVNSFRNKNKYESIIDIGCGTGFLGFISAEYFNVKNVFLTDWTCTAYLFSIINHYRNSTFKQINLNFLLGLDFNWINQDEIGLFDLIICNPPYLPIPEEYSELRRIHTVAGTDLLSKIIIDGSSVSKNIFVQFSNLSDEVVNSIIKNMDSKITIDKISDSTLSVPFRVRIALDKKEYIDWLLKNGLHFNDKSPYLYFHDLSVYQVHA